MELDLHGVRHADAYIQIEEFILRNEGPLKIITGNSVKMKAIVMEVANAHGFAFIEIGPYIIVS